MGRVTSLINEHQKCVDKKPLGIHYPKQKTLSNSFTKTNIIELAQKTI